MECLSLTNNNKCKPSVLRAEKQVHEAIMLLEPELTQEYNEAMAFVPNLVQKETKPIYFLRREEYNPYKAALRLVRYWKARKQFFGERWLLPMTQSGAGALDSDMVATVRNGVWHVVEKPYPVGFTDFSRLPRGVDFEKAMAQIMMYIGTVHTAEVFQTEGICVLNIISSRFRPTVLPMPEVRQIIGGAVPLKMKKILVASTYEEGFEHLLDYRLYHQQRVSEVQYSKNFPVAGIRGNSQRETLQLLIGNGFHRHSLPREFGGDFDFDKSIAEFTRMRSSLEDVMASAPPVRNAQLMLPQMVQQPQVMKVASQARQSAAVIRKPKFAKKKSTVERLPGEPVDLFRKRRKAIYDKLASERRTETRIQLNAQVQDLSHRNDLIRQDNRRLESLLTQARLVAALSTQDSLRHR